MNMIKTLVCAVLALSVVACSDTVNTETQRSNDNTALKNLDSSALINDSSLLPSDSTRTTVTH